MVTFEQALSTETWTEILNGGSYLAFDVLSDATVEIYFTQTADDPGDVRGNTVFSSGDEWHYEGDGFEDGIQRIWVKGNATIRGVRE